MATPHFEGTVRAEWLRHEGPDRKMRLLEDFAFVDAAGHRWEAAAGRVVDGASIPPLLWTVAGSPFVGDYRRATVLHDVACDDQTQPHELVHRMFYDAMRADGVGEFQAQQFYFAVRVFGPKWQVMNVTAAGAKRRSQRGKVAAAATQSLTPSLTIDELAVVLDAALDEATPGAAANVVRARRAPRPGKRAAGSRGRGATATPDDLFGRLERTLRDAAETPVAPAAPPAPRTPRGSRPRRATSRSGARSS